MFRKKFLSMVLLAGMLISQSIPTVQAQADCDHAQFVSDLTAPDGSSFAAGAAFTKTWRLANIGTCTWTTSYNVVWVGGDSIGAPASVRLPVDVPPGQMVDVSVNLTAPTTSGHYKALFKISNASGTQFGIGDSGADPFWADINVVSVNATIYDFVANAPYAQWKSGAGILPFPGTSGDSRGFAYQLDKPHLEDDSIDSTPGLLVVPQNKWNGYIQATYPEFQIQQGDHLQTLVNCEFGATGCYVTFRIDYLLPNGIQKTLWSWKEAYDKRFYRTDIDLSSLTGQKVRFVFMLLSSGFASGDRAIWGSPRIVRSGTTQPPAPPATLTPLPPLPPTPTPIGQPPPTVIPSGCDKAAFIADVNVPDGSIFSPGAAFTKTWRLKNMGTCTWTTSYKLLYYSGDSMRATTVVNLPWSAAPGQTVDVSVNMVAPTTAGKYRGYWILSNAFSQYFGIGAAATDPIWVEINVAGEAPHEGGYDFWQNACSAEWKSGSGSLPCPGTEGDGKGFIIPANNSHLEDGTTGPAPSFLMAPEDKYNGYIQGTFPTFTVQPGDHFTSVVGCEYGYNCYVTFRLDYMAANGGIFTFWSWREKNDQLNYTANIDLTPLAGRSVRFILTVLATGNSTGDRVRWGAPSIVRAGGTPITITPPSVTPPTITPAPSTITPVPNDWLTYTNSVHGFQFRYPPQSQRFFETDSSVMITLPVTPGTNLMEKYLQVNARAADPCQSPLSATSPPGSPTGTVVINGISFFKQTGGDAGAGNLHEWVAYSTLKNNDCISMDFMLHSLGVGAFATPVPEFDKAAESAVFAQIMSTFAWTTAPPPPTTPPPTLTPITPTVITPTVSPVVVPSPNIRKLFMIDASNGWAIGNSYVLRTADGGTTWYDVSMPGVSSVLNAFFQTSSKGWVLTPDSIYRTVNGGQNWTQSNVPFSGGYLQFLNDTNGFVLSGEASGMNKHAVSLYQTTNGGATWTLKYAVDPSSPNNSLPFSGHKNGMTFRDTSTGWVGGDYPQDGYVYLYKTTNSGVSWTKQSLSLPTGYTTASISITSPIFFGTNDAILPVRMSTNASSDLFIYVSHNGGASWTRSASVVPQGRNWDFITVNDGFAWSTNGFLLVTHNAGGSWTQVTPSVNFGDNVAALDFVSNTTGWILQNAGTSTPLSRTTDGGATWTLLSGGIPPTTPAPQLLSDLTIVELHIELQNTSCLGPDSVMGVRAWIKNNGQAAAGSFVVRVNGVDQTVNGLAAGETTAAFFPNYSNPVTAIVDATNTVTESDESNNSRSEMVPVPTPPLPCITPTFTPTPTGTPAALTGPYAVVRVGLNDVLNIRASAGGSQPVVGSFPADTVNVMRTGATASADNATWWEVQNPSGGTGWVNSYYLTEYVSHDAFCADPRIPILLEQLKGSMNQSNGDMFAGIVSPIHGTDVHLWAYQPEVNFTTTTARTVFSSTQSYNWGTGPSSNPDVGTFAQVIQPKMLEVFNAPNMETYCDNLTKVFTLAHPWPYTNIRYYNLYKPASSDATLDFRTWLIGFEYINGQPYLYSMVTIVWEP